MSYISIFKNIPEILSQPTGIAAIASLGIHGAIALIVPLMPVNTSASSKADSPKAVGLMELSTADQSRLPQPPSTSQVALQQPKLPIQQQLPGADLGSPLTNYPPLQTELSNQPVLPAIPSSPTNYNLSYLPTRQSIERLTRNDLHRAMSRLPRSTYTPSISPFVNNLDQRKRMRETGSLGINRLPELRQSNEIPGEPLNNPSAEPIDIGTGSSTTVGISPPQTVESDSNAVKIVQGGEKIALVDNSRGQSPEILRNESDSKGQRTEQLLAKLNSYNNLRQNIRQEYPNIKEKGVIRETISTDTPEMEGTVVGRLVVDSDGKVLDIKFQEGTESPKLQSKVREFFSANPPQADKQVVSSYPFQLKFQNNPNASGVSSKIQPSVTTNTEKVFESQIKPSATPNTEKLPESQIKPSATPNTEKLPESQIKPSVTPNTEKLPELPIKPSATLNLKKLPELKIQPSGTSDSKKLPELKIQPSATLNLKKLPEPQNTQNSSATPAVNTPDPVKSATPSSDSPAVSTESNQKLIQKLRQIKEEEKNPE
ncbi:hypothetical protein MEO93_18435 [Dolichospermum sp. ST_sed3]|nr:hypothetical protein [Dolichospermum sp. ST_sed9]MDD1442301.1 hypothetical protein [Dolichospermum sp. ST_sed3]MDD1463028.1 hypothetical protein [Dolichospermum sp. ST_sed2]